MGRVEGKSIIVTGGAKGIGRACCESLAREGAQIVLADIDEKLGLQATEEIQKNGNNALFFRHDVTSESSWDELTACATVEFGGVDVLVNNAGILLMKPLTETTLEEWNNVLNVNVTGTFLGTRAVFQTMRNKGGGSIINLSSIYGLVGAPQAAAYEASKGAVRLFSKGAATEYAEYGIRVNSVHPGVIDTPMAHHLLLEEEMKSAVLGPTLLKRAGLPEEIAAAVLFLASDESSFMVGSEMVVDGGYSCN